MLRDETLRLQVVINGDPLVKTFRTISAEVNATTKEISKLERQYDRLSSAEQKGLKGQEKLAEIDKQKELLTSYMKALRDSHKAGDLTKMSVSDLRNYIKLLKIEMDEVNPHSERYVELRQQLEQASGAISRIGAQSRSFSQGITSFAKSFSYVYYTASNIYNAISTVVDRLSALTQGALVYDEAMTDASKTTNLTKEEIRNVGEVLKKFDTRTAQNELMNLVRIGGKLGISGKEDLVGFARAADVINVALGEDLGGNAEEAITAIGKMVDIFNLTDEFGVEQAMLKVGSAVNSLGMASTANEGYMVDFTKRLAGIAPNADISIDKVLGLAATLDKYGQQSETSSTAIGQTIVAMFKRTETFANLAKMPFEDFKNLLSRDVNGALLKVMEGIRSNGGGMDVVAQAMDEMNLNGQRATTVLGTLVNNYDELRTQQELAAQAFSDGNSVTDEANVKNSSATAIIEKKQKAIENLKVEIGEKFLPIQEKMLTVQTSLLGTLSNLASFLLYNKNIIITLITAYATLFLYKNRFLILNKIESASLFLTKTIFQGLISGLRNMKTAYTATFVATKANTIANGFLSISFVTLKAAIKGVNAALKANPLGFIIGLVTTLAVAVEALMNVFNRASEKRKEALREEAEQRQELLDGISEVNKEMAKEKSQLEQLKTAAMNAAVGTDARKKAIDTLNEQYGSYLPKLLTEKSSNDEIAAAIASVNSQLETNYRLKARLKGQETIDKNNENAVSAFTKTIRDNYSDRNDENMSIDKYQQLTSLASRKQKFLLDGGNKAEEAKLDAEIDKFIKDNNIKRRVWNKAFNSFSVAIEGNKLDEAQLDTLYGKLDQGVVVTPGSPDFIGPVLNNGKTNTGNNSGGGAVNAGGTNPKNEKPKWDLKKDATYLAESKKLRDDFIAGAILSEEEYNKKIYDLEVSILYDRLLNEKISAEERQEIRDELRKRAFDKQKEANNEAAKLEEEGRKIIEEGYDKSYESLKDKEIQEFEEKKKRFSGNAKVIEALERKHAATMSKIELDEEDRKRKQAEADFNLKMAETKNRHKQEIQAFTGSAAELKALKERQEKELTDIQRNYLESEIQTLKRIVSTIQSGEISADPETITKLKQEIENATSDLLDISGKKVNELKTSIFSGTGDGELFGISQSQWESFFGNLSSGKLGVEDLKTAISSIQNVSDEIFGMISQGMDVLKAKENEQMKQDEKNNDKKKERLKNRLDAGLMTEAQYNAEVEAMDAEMEAKKQELEVKQAERQKKFNIIQAIINTALSVTKTLAQWGLPWGLIPAGIAAAMGAAQIAMIAAQPTSPGYEEGGMIDTVREQDGKRFRAKMSPDARGLINTPTVLVSENGGEYVIPAEGVNNPSIRPFINTIEFARRNGKLRSLNLSAVGNYATGKESGGYVSGSGDGSQSFSGSDSGIYSAELIAVMNKLLTKLDEPIHAEVSLLGKRGIMEKMDEYNRNKSRGRL